MTTSINTGKGASGSDKNAKQDTTAAAKGAAVQAAFRQPQSSVAGVTLGLSLIHI